MTDNLLKIREAFAKEGGENCNGVRWTDEAIARIAELEAELKWAWDNMRFTAPPAAEDSEYDFCLVCGCPEWEHDEKCTAKQHKENAAKLLKG